MIIIGEDQNFDHEPSSVITQLATILCRPTCVPCDSSGAATAGTYRSWNSNLSQPTDTYVTGDKKLDRSSSDQHVSMLCFS
jgi:hypothetical protein